MEALLSRPSIPEKTTRDEDGADENGGKAVFGFGDSTIGGGKFEVYFLKGRGKGCKTKQETDTGGEIVQTGNADSFMIFTLE